MTRSFLQRLRDDNPESEDDLFNSDPYDDMKTELGMLLSSRPLYIFLDEYSLVNDSVLNYGINYSLYTALGKEHCDIVNDEISERILLAIRRYAQNMSNPEVKHSFSNDESSVFTVTAQLSTDIITFSIVWDKHSGTFSLYE